MVTSLQLLTRKTSSTVERDEPPTVVVEQMNTCVKDAPFVNSII